MSATQRRGPVAGRPPSLRLERALLDSGTVRLAGMDEVGRGALSGPVSVGVAVVAADVRRPPGGLRDSKLLTPTARVALVPRIHRWASGHAVGHASPAEIDAHGILGALRLAGHRALAQLPEAVDLVLLDGNHDWLTPPPPDLLDCLDLPSLPDADLDRAATGWRAVRTPPILPDGVVLAPVRLQVKADLTCASVAAASVLAKAERDGLMCRLAGQYPDFGWEDNKGYATPTHVSALRALGPCAAHRRSWRLPGQQMGEYVDDEAEVVIVPELVDVQVEERV